MEQLIYCILFNVGIFVCFRLLSQYRLNTFQAIITNYGVCVLTGLIFVGGFHPLLKISVDTPWLVIAIGLGSTFVGAFYLMAITTQKFSITVSSVATKMSLILTVLFSLLILGIKSKEYTTWNYLGMITALFAILLSSYKERKIKSHAISGFELALPLLLFLIGGVLDSTINFTSYKYLTKSDEGIFPIVTFMSAFTLGVVILIIKKQKIDFKSMLAGIVLGVVNYFSIYFLITSLSAFNNDGAIVYPLINVGIIILAAITSVIFFSERVSKLNLLGLVLAVLSIILISYQELLAL